MSKIQGMIQVVAHMYASPKEMLVQINRRIFDGMDRKSFITMILALFDTQTKTVRICRAGHTRALLKQDGTIRFLKGVGLALGLERGELFEKNLDEMTLPFDQNDFLLLYTDGVTESMNEQKQEFGEELLISLIKEYPDAAPKEIQRLLLDRMNAFRGNAEQHDDMTLVAVKAKR
jgi:serine phosphatase RsbU (regulator of sigma subunit)